MFSNLLKDRTTMIIVAIFAIIAIVASEILVLDEEALVAGCFIMFVLFASQTMGDMVASELDDRALKIRNELEKSFIVKRDFLVQEIENSKKQESLVKELQDLFSFSNYLMKLIGTKKRNQIEDRVTTQINNQLRLVAIKEKEIIDSLQKDAVNAFANSVLEEFKGPKGSALRAQLLDESISAIKAACK